MSAQNQAKRQVAMVMDLNKCIGCQTCSVSCKQLWTNEEGMEYQWWNIVNTMPGKGTPKNWEKMGGGFIKDAGATTKARPGHIPTINEFGDAWDFNYDEVLYGGKGTTTQLKPTDRHGNAPEWGPNWDEDEGGGDYPNSFFFYLPRTCNHCTNPACKEACPRGAIEKRDEDGIVLLNEDKCRGYRFCMQACPYKKIYFNHKKQVSQKCIFCFPRVEQKVAPACVRQCPGRVRLFGYKDDPESPVHKLVEEWKVALPLHPEYGTEPNVFYIPPMLPKKIDANGEFDESARRVPDEYLVSLFGPKVLDVLEKLEGEMKKKRQGGKSEILETLIGYKWTSLFKGFDNNPADL